MPKIAKELTPLAVRKLAHDGRKGPMVVAVGGVAGLMVTISPTGAKSWILRYRIGQRRRELGLGPFPEISLADARSAATDARALLRQGTDPLDARKAALAATERQKTFAEAMDAFLEQKVQELTNAKHIQQWRNTLTTYALPHLGHLPVDAVGTDQLLAVLQPIWTTKTETATRVRQRIEAVLQYAIARGWRPGPNPAIWRGGLQPLLPKPAKIKKVRHHPSVAQDDMAAWYADLQSRSGTATRALEFLALTAARSGEVRGMRWDEVQGDVWVVPADRMKMGRRHRVPLSQAAMALLAALPRDNDLVFPATRGGMLSDMSLSACMKRQNEKHGFKDPDSSDGPVPHGLRSTFKVWASRAGISKELSELALAHAKGDKVEAAYQRDDLLEQRRPVMEAWAEALTNTRENKVITLRG